MGIKMSLEDLSPEYQRQALQQMEPEEKQMPTQTPTQEGGCMGAAIIVISFICLVITGELWRD